MRTQNNTQVVYQAIATGLNLTFLTTGAYQSSSPSLSTYNCVANTWSITQLYANGRAFNIAKGPSGNWLASGSDAYYNAGKVGIGTSVPGSKLTVAGVIESSTGGIKFPDGTTQTTAASGSGGSNYQEFTSSGTWTKPASGNMIFAECWGGGGSGAAGNTSTVVGGGGGGGYSSRMIPAAQVSSTVSVTIGNGGASVSNAVGNVGGTSSFGSYLLAYGGGGGSWNGGSGGGSIMGGGGGGGQMSAGNSSGVSGKPLISNGGSMYCGGGGGGSTTSVHGCHYHGGGGGAGRDDPATWPAGDGMYGGGGGSAVAYTSGGSAGTSLYGGAGGAANTAGAVPGGGGGASTSGASGAGGKGLCRITTY